MERVFDITKEDHLNIELAEAVGVTHLAVSYPQVSIKVNVYKIFKKHMIEGYQLHVDQVINKSRDFKNMHQHYGCWL